MAFLQLALGAFLVLVEIGPGQLQELGAVAFEGLLRKGLEGVGELLPGLVQQSELVLGGFLLLFEPRGQSDAFGLLRRAFLLQLGDLPVPRGDLRLQFGNPGVAFLRDGAGLGLGHVLLRQRADPASKEAVDNQSGEGGADDDTGDGNQDVFHERTCKTNSIRRDYTRRASQCTSRSQIGRMVVLQSA